MSILKKLYEERRCMLHKDHGIRPDHFTEEDDEDIIMAICKSNIFKLKIANSIINMLENDGEELRRFFISQKLKELESNNSVSCLLTLIEYIDKLNLQDFIRALDHTTFFNRYLYKGSKDNNSYKIRDLAKSKGISFKDAGIELIKKFTESLTEVYFVKSLDGEVMAVFPNTVERDEMVCIYTHIGQHNYATLDYIEDETVEIAGDEYAELKKEMEGIIKYNLKVVDRVPKSENWSLSLTYNEALYCVIHSICNVWGKVNEPEEGDWIELSVEKGDVDFDESTPYFNPYFSTCCSDFAVNYVNDEDVMKIKKELRSEKFIEFLKNLKNAKEYKGDDIFEY